MLLVPEDRTVQLPCPGRFLLFHTHYRKGSLSRAAKATIPCSDGSNGIVALEQYPQTKACSQVCCIAAGSTMHATSGHHEVHHSEERDFFFSPAGRVAFIWE